MHQSLKGREIILYAKTLAPTLGKKERSIAHFIENNPDVISTMRINEVSKFLKVSIASITKVSKKLGCSGFHELKNSISEISASDQDSLQQDFHISSRYEDILERTFLNSILALQESLTLINSEVFNQVALLLINFNENNKIILAGCGGSRSICDDFHHKLLKIGIFSNVYYDSHMQQMSASLMKPGDILFAVSHSGKTADVINMLKTARENGADTVSITNYFNSPVTQVSDYAIISSVKNNPITGENASTRIVHLNILDALFTILANERGQKSQDSLQKTRDSVQSKRI
ncbi:SIS domain-containing protein [Sodalis ligni]|uniref:RpiR family transcriptional regulator n=1 Tax=Sodalis ligni TaxID=2697027 RepID=A0A4R1N7Q0_9GAMM|nr:SIS domain-containing protein [Sodalis ligni]TCL03213.1 RpiR family transcriptional regulator [Sodalis ligni]